MLFLVRNESSPLGISFVDVALDFQGFLAQTVRLEKSNSKEPERVVVVAAQNEEPTKVEIWRAEEQVFSPFDQSGVSNFALDERKIKKKKRPSVSTNQHSVILPSML